MQDKNEHLNINEKENRIKSNELLKKDNKKYKNLLNATSNNLNNKTFTKKMNYANEIKIQNFYHNKLYNEYPQKTNFSDKKEIMKDPLKVYSETNIDINALSKLSWGGLPEQVRPMSYRLFLNTVSYQKYKHKKEVIGKMKMYSEMIENTKGER